MSLTDKINAIANPTRRGFLRQALSAVASPLLPKGALGAVGELSDALPDLSGYALKEVSGRALQFFGGSISFSDVIFRNREDLNSTSPVHINYGLPLSIINGTHCISLYYLDELVRCLDHDFEVPEFVNDGEPFKVGHLLSPDNLKFFIMADGDTDFNDPVLRELSLANINFIRCELKEFLNGNPNFGTIQDLAQMPLKEFYKVILIPAHKISLETVVSKALAESDNYKLGRHLEIMGDKHFKNLKREYPEWADNLEKIHEEYIAKEEYDRALNKHLRFLKTHPPGHFRMEKESLGAYKLHTPEIR